MKWIKADAKIDQEVIDNVVRQVIKLKEAVDALSSLYERYNLNDIQPESFEKVIPMSLDEWSADLASNIDDWNAIDVSK